MMGGGADAGALPLSVVASANQSEVRSRVLKHEGTWEAHIAMRLGMAVLYKIGLRYNNNIMPST